ncbi:MAG: DUF6165 family protein [Myxococcota bacterium]
MKVEIPIGDVVDKVTILDIKRCKLHDSQALNNVERERQALRDGWTEHGLTPMEGLPQWEELRQVNEALWDVEDALRACEAQADFGSRFVELARSVYRLNDKRAALKRSINLHLGSTLVEEKSYHGATP